MTLVYCHRCEGKGKVALPAHLEETLASVPKRKTITAETIAVLLHTTPEAQSMRLLDLLLLGLVRRVRDGKFWRYSRV